MTDQTGTARSKRPIDYSKKYWWLGAIAIPLLVAIIAKLPFGSDSPVPGTTYISNVTVIENEYREITGTPLDQELKEKIQRAIDLGKKHYFAESARLFQEVAEKVQVPAIYTDLGVVLRGANQNAQAESAYKEALRINPQYAAAAANVREATKETHIQISDHEIEPNDDVFHANVISLNTSVSASIADPSDQDFYVFTTPPTYRDWIQVEIKSVSNLRPGLRVLNSEKSDQGGDANGNQAGNLRYLFVCEPSSTYYLHVSTAPYTDASSGAYILTVRALKAYDKYEPNDDVRHPSNVKLGEVIEASIMDPGDVDFYHFQSGKSGNITVTLTNRSQTLRPGIRVLNHDRSDIGGNSNDNPGGHVDFSFSAEAGAEYYVRISTAPYADGSAGEYSLIITQQ